MFKQKKKIPEDLSFNILVDRLSEGKMKKIESDLNAGKITSQQDLDNRENDLINKLRATLTSKYELDAKKGSFIRKILGK